MLIYLSRWGMSISEKKNSLRKVLTRVSNMPKVGQHHTLTRMFYCIISACQPSNLQSGLPSHDPFPI